MTKPYRFSPLSMTLFSRSMWHTEAGCEKRLAGERRPRQKWVTGATDWTCRFSSA